MRFYLILFSILFIFNSPSVFAEDDVESVIKYRQNMMSIISKHYKSLKLLSVGRVNRSEHWLPHAQGLYNMALLVESVYPEGSFSDKSDAKKSIWEQKDNFNQKAKAMVQHTEKLLNLVKQGNNEQIMQLMREVSQSCKDCHKLYREK